MRNKFTELVHQGVARFEYKPDGPETPCNCPLCRAYNNLWGVLTDTHMSKIGDNEWIMTGTLFSDEKKWSNLQYACTWGAVRIDSSGYCSLSNFFYSNGVTPQSVIHNGQPAIKLVSAELADAVAVEPVRSYVTSESRFPQPIERIMSRTDLLECMQEGRTLPEIATAMNESVRIPGEHWCSTSTGICGYINGQCVILEMNYESGSKVVDKALADALEKEDLGALYLRQFPKCFVVDSDDKQWRGVLRKCKFNKINISSFDELNVDGWVDEIKSIINTIS